MRLPNNIMSVSRDDSHRIESTVQSFDATVYLTRKVWIALDDESMKKELDGADYYDAPSDYFNDVVVDYEHEGIKGFKIDIGDCCSEQPTNIEYSNCSHDVGYDSHSKIHMCKGLQYFYMKGTDIPEIQDLDLSKFYQRYQVEEVEQENIDKPRLPTKFMFDDSRDIDTKLLVSWIKHQLMLKMFECTYDPFYMEDEQIQQESSGYMPNDPKYDMPEGFSVHVKKIEIIDSHMNLLK
jgi:hypothetical protein